MTKIIHASDFQLGRQFSGLGKTGDLLRRALKDSFEAAVNKSLENSVDLLLVSGNFFAGNLVSRHLVDFVYGQVSRLGRIPFVVLPGVSDHLEENSIYRHLPQEGRPDNFYLLGNGDQLFINFPDSDLTLYSTPPLNSQSASALQLSVKKQPFQGVHLVVVPSLEHSEAGTQNGSTNGIDWLQSQGFDYIAVGNSLSYRQWSERAFSSGSPEGLDFGVEESGQILLVEFDAVSPPKVDRIATATLIWKQLEVKNENFRFNIEVERELQKYANPQTLLRIKITGSFVREGYLDLITLEQEHQHRFAFLELEDLRASDEADFVAPAINGGGLIAEYAELLIEAGAKAPSEMKQEYRQALYSGCALLSGKDVIK